MEKKIRQLGALLEMTLAVAIFASSASGQVKEIEYKAAYYTKLESQWVKYRAETVLPYYNDSRYAGWARSEYQRATDQILAAERYKTYYQRQLKQTVPGTETIVEECWVRVANGTCTMIYGRVINYDNGAWDRSDYDNKRKQMADSGYYFAYARDYSRKRFGEPKYR